MENITIPLETYKCLREHLKKANELFNSLGLAGSNPKNSIASKLQPKQNIATRKNDYKNRIENGLRGRKPLDLKK